MQKENAPRTNQERTEATRAALLSAARALFVTKGYAGTSTPEIVARAGLTRGALYHHFIDKADVLRSVVTREARAVADAIDAATQALEDPLEGLGRGTDAYFDAMREPGRARLLLIEGPVVLGPREMDRIDRLTGGGRLRDGLRTAVDRDAGRDWPLDELAAMLSAGFDRAALAIADGASSEPYRRAARRLLACLLIQPGEDEAVGE